MKLRLLVAVLAVLCVSAMSAMAGDPPLPRYAGRVERANIQAMIDPPGSFSVTYWGKDTAGQCPINPNWTVTVTLRPDIDGTYIQSVCPRTGPTPCECDIFVRTTDTQRAWEAALEPYRQEHKRTLPVDPSPDAKVQTGSLIYSTAKWNGPETAPSVVDLTTGTVDVSRGDEFKFMVDALVPAGAESPCADPTGRPCYLTTELWQVRPDGKREFLRFEFEIGEMGRVWLEPGRPVQVPMKAIFPHAKSYYPIPKGKMVLVGKWFLWKNYWSLADFQVPVGQFEVALNVR